MSEIYISNGRIITTAGDFTGNLLIRDGFIAEVSAGKIRVSDYAKTIDATGRYILPGFIDPHVHMELPTPAGNSADDFRTGSLAALAGGTTTIMDFVTPLRDQSLMEALHERKTLASKSVVDYALHVSPLNGNPDTIREIEKCIYEEGITSFKVYLAYRKTIGIGDDTLAAVMETIGKAGGLLMLHCENDGMVSYLQDQFIAKGNTVPKYHALSRPPEAEAEAIGRAISFSRQFGCPVYIVHVSTAEGAGLIARARKEGLRVYGETCPQYLLLDMSEYEAPFDEAAAFVMSPPLREKRHRERLWKALAEETLQTTGTDHCPFNKDQKTSGRHDFTRIPNGAGGVEFRPSLLFTYGVLPGKISLQQWIKMISANAARIFGLTSKGDLKADMDADVVIWNPETAGIISRKSQLQHCDQNIYEGMEIKGSAETVIAGGKIRVENGKVTDAETTGRFLRRGHSV